MIKQNKKNYAIVYLDSKAQIDFTFNLTENTVEDFMLNERNLEELGYRILFSQFGVSEKQKGLILSKEFNEVYRQSFSKVKEKANSLITKLKSAEK